MIASRTSTSRLSLLAMLVASGAALAACDVDPIGGGTGGGGGDDTQTSVVSTSTGVESQVSTSTGLGGSGGAGGSGGSNAGGADPVGGGSPGSGSIALYGDEIPDSTGEGGSTSVGVSGTSGGGTGFEPERLYLFVSSAGALCADPFGVDADCAEDVSTATIGLPPEYQTAGVYDLSDPAIISNFSEYGPAGQGQCAGGGGSFVEGTIEVVSVESDRVRIILAGTSPATLEGQHNVYFCGSEPTDDSNVIGYFPSELPPPESGSSGQSGGGEEEKFILIFADHAQSCADPFGNQPGPGEVHEELVVRLPPAYLTPGTYALDEVGIETDYFTYEENTAASGGGETIGSLTITEVGADFIALELDGTPYDFANGGAQVPRCGG